MTTTPENEPVAKHDGAPRPLMQRIRLRVMAIVVGAILAAVATISLTSIPAWPIVGVAFATVAVCVNTLTSRLRTPVCYGCGADISRLPNGEYGVICPDCGSLTTEFSAEGGRRRA